MRLRTYKNSLRVRMPRTWWVFHRATSFAVGKWKDKGAARRWLQEWTDWRKVKGIAGPHGWELRQSQVQYYDD